MMIYLLLRVCVIQQYMNAVLKLVFSNRWILIAGSHLFNEAIKQEGKKLIIMMAYCSDDDNEAIIRFYGHSMRKVD